METPDPGARLPRLGWGGFSALAGFSSLESGKL